MAAENESGIKTNVVALNNLGRGQADRGIAQLGRGQSLARTLTEFKSPPLKVQNLERRIKYSCGGDLVIGISEWHSK